MKRRVGLVVCFVMLATLVFGTVPASADNTVSSSTMIFEGTLTDEGGGVYSGVLAMVDEDALNISDDESGYDVYARNGALARFGDDPGGGPVWTSVAIGTDPNSDHDGWPTWDPDTPDWYQYSLNLYLDSGEYRWAVRNHPGATAANPWYDEAHWGAGGKIARGVPMSGAMNWTNDYACETDTGAYLPGTGVAEIPGGAAGQGGGPACWDMDWSWGSEVVPLEFPGFDVSVAAQGGGIYRVTLTPAEGPVKNLNTGETFCSIQAAIDDADTLDTHVIEVANGTYTEQVSVGKGLTIQGESESGVIVQAAAAQTGSANTFTINAAGKDVTIKTMTIRHGDYGIRSTAGNVNVLHCALYHNGWDGTNLPDPDTDPQSDFVTFFATYATNGGAIRIENSAGSEIAYCTVYENDRGIRYQDSDNGDIHDNKSYNNIESGIYLSSSTYEGDEGCTNTVVYDNESYGNMNNGLLSIGGHTNTLKDNDVHDNWNTGVMLWSPSEITVEHNTIVHNNLYSFNGQGVSGDAKGGVWVAAAESVTSRAFAAKIIKNTISNNQLGRALKKEGVRIEGSAPGDGIEIKHNAFTLQEIDVHILGQAGTVKVNYNSFVGADVGVQSDDTMGIVDAEHNWWGDASGPEDLLGSDEASPGTCFDPSTMKNADGTGDGVSDLYVDYCPWLACPATLWVEPVEEAYLIDEIFDVVIRLRSEKPTYGAQVMFTYDPSALEYQSHTVGDFGGSGPQVVFDEDPLGTVLIGVSRIAPEAHFLGEGVLMTIQFKAKGGDTSLALSDAILADSDANTITPVCLEDGMIYGEGTGIMEGTVELQGRNGPPKDWDAAAVTLVHETWTVFNRSGEASDADGNWTYSGLAAGNYTVEVEMARYLDAKKTGQAVTDGNTTTLNQVKLLGGDAVAPENDCIDINDLNLIGGQFGNTPPDPGFEGADINDDGTVNILDLVLAGGNYMATSPVNWP